jgi:uncharacterized protein YkwD
MRFVFLFLVLTLAACAPKLTANVTEQPVISLAMSAGSVAGLTPQASPASFTVPEAYTLMLSLINEARAKARNCGGSFLKATKPLTYNPFLAQSAQIHALDMSQNQFFGHIGSDGSDVSARVSATSYAWARVGENLAFGSLGHYQEKDIVQGWLASAGHCKNIMNPDFREIGMVKFSNNYDYWVHVFGVSN